MQSNDDLVMPQLWNDNAPLGSKVPELPELSYQFVANRRRGWTGSSGSVCTARAVVVIACDCMG